MCKSSGLAEKLDLGMSCCSRMCLSVLGCCRPRENLVVISG
jgi:hypothetical protein